MTYKEYLQTDHWKKMRKWALEFWDYKCALCYDDANLHVHHRTYIRMGNEKITDLIVLCDKCHDYHHFGDKLNWIPLEKIEFATAG